MMTLAQLLHSKGFYITMVLTEFNAARLATSLAAESLTLQCFHDFSFETIPDGLPPDNKWAVVDLPKLALSLGGEPKEAFRSLLVRLLDSSDIPPISSIIFDATMFFALDVGKELGIPFMFFQTTSPCAMLGYLLYDELVERGLFPLKGEIGKKFLTSLIS
ncbi:7-deoxyloganetin glucosyltransferase [Bienertia sinuspersici]